MSYLSDALHTCVFLAVGTAFGLPFILALAGDGTHFIHLGDEVATTTEYNTLFNGTFSGHVVSITDGMYTVQNETGTTQSFEFKWLTIVVREGDI